LIALGIVLTSIIAQQKFDLLYSLVYLENTYLHEELANTQIQITDLKENFAKPIYRMDISATVKFSSSPEYDFTIFIPDEYTVLKQPQFIFKEEHFPGYKGIYFRLFTKKYRDITGEISIFLYSKKINIPEKPLLTLFKKNGLTVHEKQKYALKSENNSISLILK
jgi:hypothetical protein